MTSKDSPGFSGSDLSDQSGSLNLTNAVSNTSLLGANPDPKNDDGLSLDIIYIVIAGSAAFILLVAVLFVFKIARGSFNFFPCKCLRRGDSDYPSEETGRTKGGRGKKGNRTKEDPTKNLIVPDIKIIDEDGNIIPRASFS